MYYFISYALFDVLDTQFNSLKNKSSIAHFVIVWKTVFLTEALWRHHSWSVTSRERGVLALWRHIRRLFFHVPFGAKAILASE